MSLSQLPPFVLSNIKGNETLEEIVGKAFKEAVQTCSTPWVIDWSQRLSGIPITFHELMTILAAVACIFNCLCSAYLLAGHLVCWVRPDQQRQILRIISWNVVYSICAFFSIYFYSAARQLHPFSTYYEGFAMTGLFLLYVFLVCPKVGDRAQYFTNLQRKMLNGRTKHNSQGSLKWFRIVWILVFQITFVRTGAYIGQEVLLGVTCPLSDTRKYGNIIIQVISGLSTGLTIVGIIMFERRMHSHLKNNGHRPMLKLISFKLIVGLESVQGIMFSVLADTGVYFPSAPYHVSWNDFVTGIPQLILVFELSIVSFVFMWAYSFEEYRAILVRGDPIQAPTWKAMLSIFDLRDIYMGTMYMFTSFTSSDFQEGSVDGRLVNGLSEHKSGEPGVEQTWPLKPNGEAEE